VVLRLSYTNDTLQHFLIALGSLDESHSLRSRQGAKDHASSLYGFSLQQYNTGISKIATDKQFQSLPALVLSACLAGVLYELWLGSHDNAHTHALAAIRIQDQLLEKTSNQASGEQATILHRYLKQIITRTSHHLSVDPKNVSLQEDICKYTSTPGSLPYDFEVLSQRLSEVASQAVRGLEGAPLKAKLQKLLAELDVWYLQITALPTFSSIYQAQERRLLEIRYHAHRITIGAAPYDDEGVYDDFETDFRAINDTCEAFLEASARTSHSKVLYTHDTTTSMALFLVTCFCRDPQIRRQSVRLLYRYPRLEGIFLTYMTGYWGELKTFLEEEGIVVQESRNIPVEKRLSIRDGWYHPGCLANNAR
jgi:hypothetical protein